MDTKRIADDWRIPDALWERIEPLLPKYPKSPKGGRPRANLRAVLDGIFYVLRTGCQWKAAPPEFGSGSALHHYFQEWTAQGIFRDLWRVALYEYDELKGIQWEWQSLDGTMTKAPLGGGENRSQPHRPSQVRDQAFAADRRPRGSLGRGGLRS
jgi:putative transposase